MTATSFITNLPFPLTSTLSPEGRGKGLRNIFVDRRRLKINETSFYCQVIFSLIFLIFPNRSIMFFDVRRKIVGPIIFGDEIEVWNGSRVDGRQKGFFAWVTDGSGRKPNNQIGVVRSSSKQMFFG
jgi:hypothetical protein